jgi:hypothetical protein
MNFAPDAAAVSSAVPRSLRLVLLASTSSMWQFGQIADTMSRSVDSSSSHPPVGSTPGSGLVWPSSLRMVRQPAAQAGSPHCFR